MSAIQGTWKNGQVQLDTPADWPEGSRVLVEPVRHSEVSGMTEEEQGDDPESIGRWLAAWDALPPLMMTPEEEAALTAWRQKVKEFNVDAVRRQMQEGIP